MPEPMILVNPEMVTFGGREWMTSPEMYNAEKHYPTWRLSDVARTFYGMSRGWLVLHLSRGYEWDGEAWQPPRTRGDHQFFRLWDVELFTHLLLENDVVGPGHAELTLTVVKSIARMHQFIT
jgi:hypothetical protein